MRAQTAGSTWTQLFPTGGPPPSRWEHTAVYDPTSNRMTVFGGSSFGPPTDSAVWVLANADGLGGPPSWTQLSPTGGPPSARVEHTSVYDPATNRMIMFAGNPNAGFCFGDANDVWVLSNANGLGTSAWTQLSPAGTPPSPRGHHTAVYDPASNRMTVFGGNQACVPADDQVWVLSNANGSGVGTPTWTQLSPAGASPGPRATHTAVYDPASNRMIVFGGCTLAVCGTNDVWVLTNANGLGGTPTWILLTPTGGPPPGRSQHTAVYDPATNTMTVFGGSSPAPSNDVWVLSNANGLGGTPTWTQLTPTGGPPTARTGHSAVYNSTANRMTIFAGLGCLTPTCSSIFFLNDVWVLTNANGLGPGLCHEGDGDGVAEGNDPRKSHFHFHKNSCAGNDSGDVETDDERSGTHFQSTSINSATFTADKDSQTVTMIGTGLNNGLPVRFTMVAVDNGYLAPGAFSLILTDGTSIIGNPAAGSILIQ